MMKKTRMHLTGNHLTVVARHDEEGKPVYDVVFSPLDATGIDLERLRALCAEIREDVDALAYTYVSGGTGYALEILNFEEESGHAHRADADGADGS